MAPERGRGCRAARTSTFVPVDLLPLTAAFRENELAIWRSRSKLYARVAHPAALYGGDSYDVNTQTATFSALSDGQSTAHGPLQVIATVFDGFWLWGRANPSIPNEAKAPLAATIAADPLFADIQSCMKFAIDDQTADSLAALIATRAGWLGAYPAPYGPGTTVYLALNLTPRNARDGAMGSHVRRLHTSSAGLR